MLCQITFENFKSFKKQALLDLFAEDLQEHEKSLIIDPYDGESFLPVIAIYGPKAGKQDIIEAFTHLTQKLFLSKASDATLEKTTGTFDILFRIDQMEYRYQQIVSNATFKEENLYSKDLLTHECFIIFERNVKDIYMNNQFGSIKDFHTNSTMPLLTYLKIHNENRIIQDVFTWFSECQILKRDEINEEMLLDSLHNGNLVVAQNIDTQFSTEAFRNIIGLFKNPNVNKNKAQLIFTTDDTSIMNSAVLQRDEIWFSAFNKKNQSKLYSLVEFKKDSNTKEFEGNYAKRYSEGRYGADPDPKQGGNP